MISTPLALLNDADLAELWFGFRRKTWRKVVDAVKATGIEQKKLAARIDMDEGQFSKIISGQRNVTLRTLFNVARATDNRLEISLVPSSALPGCALPWRFSPTSTATGPM